MTPVLATFLLGIKALATRADSDSYLLDPGAGQEQCHEDEATSLVQLRFAVKRSNGSGADNRTEASTRIAGNGVDSAPLAPLANPGTCSMVSVGCWASLETYSRPDLQPGIVGGVSEVNDKQWHSWMQATGWAKDQGLSIEAADGLGFWTHAASGDCVLAFRGSDSAAEAVLQSAVGFGSLPGADGIWVTSGVKAEFDQYFAAIKDKVGGSDVYAQEGLKKYTDKCPGGIIAAGHSLGGGVAQLFAHLANRHGDPLGMKLPYAEGVKAVYGYGALPVGYEITGSLQKKELANDKRADGCFPGGMYATAEKTVKKVWAKTGTHQVQVQTGASWQWVQQGWFGHWSLVPTYGYVTQDTWGWVDQEEIMADWASVNMGRVGLVGHNWHVKTSMSLVYDKSNGVKTYQCGDKTEWWKEVKGSFGSNPDLHMMSFYSNRIGCM